MISFKTFLNEKTTDAVVAAFGRMAPATIGHGLLVDVLLKTAHQHNADHVIYLSKTKDGKSNPLDVAAKVVWAKKMFPGVNILPATPETNTFLDMVKTLNKKYKNLYVIAGSDRAAEYDTLINKYNGNLYHYDTINVVSAGVRDPDADGASGMSASKMRAAALTDDERAFKLGLPTSMYIHAKAMMLKIKNGTENYK